MTSYAQTKINSKVLEKLDPSRWKKHQFGLSNNRWEKLSGKSFWVLGAGTGYGRCIALALMAAGAQVFISGRRIEKLQETISEGQDLGINMQQCVPLVVDIVVESDIASAAKVISENTTQLYGLINCAALPQSHAESYPLENQNMATWSSFLATNLTGQWLTSKIALPLMFSGEALRILFISSEAGWAATPGFGPYNVCKSALNTLAASFAAECAERFPDKDIQINVLVPGEARTEMNQNSSVSPFSVVSMVLTLLSHPSGGPNGCFFHRDGRHLAFAHSQPFPQELT